MIGGLTSAAFCGIVGAAMFVESGDVEGPGGIKISRKFDLATPGVPTAATWSPDGSTLAAASNYGQDVVVWDRSGNMINHFKRFGGGPFTFNSLSFVGGSSQLLFFPPENALESTAFDIWDVATGQVTKAIPGPAPTGHYQKNRAYNFVASPDQSLAAGAPFIGGAVVIYETRDWKQRHVIKFNFAVSSLCFFADGRHLAVSSLEGDVAIVDVLSGAVISNFHLYDTKYGEIAVEALAISEDGQLILTGVGLVTLNGAYAGTSETRNWADAIDRHPVRVWRTKDGSAVASFAEARNPIRQAIADPRGRYFAFVDATAKLFFWQPIPTSNRIEIELPAPTLSLAATMDGKRLAVANGAGIRIYEIK